MCACACTCYLGPPSMVDRFYSALLIIVFCAMVDGLKGSERGTLSKGLFSYVQVLALALVLVLVLVPILNFFLGSVRDYGMAVLEVVSVAGYDIPWTRWGT